MPEYAIDITIRATFPVDAENAAAAEAEAEAIRADLDAGKAGYLSIRRDRVASVEVTATEAIDSVERILDTGTVLRQYPVDESQDNSHAGDALLIRTPDGKLHEYIVWNERAENHQAGEVSVRCNIAAEPEARHAD